MYSHPEINYKPQHPMLQNYTQQQKGYTVEDEGVFDSIKAGLSKAGSAIAKGAKAAKEFGAGVIGVSTAKKMTKANKAKWHAYYLQERAIREGKIPQKAEEKAKREQKQLRTVEKKHQLMLIKLRVTNLRKKISLHQKKNNK